MNTKRKSLIRKIIYTILFTILIVCFIFIGNKYTDEDKDKIVSINDYYKNISYEKYEVVRGKKLISLLEEGKHLILVGNKNSEYSKKYIEELTPILEELKIDKIRTRKEWAQIINKEQLPFYYAESIYYNDKNGGFVLSYLMLKVIGGDKREGKKYIVTEDYYARTGVKTRDPYQKRKNTILSKTGETRNYNNGINLYQVDYTRNGKKHKYMAKTIDELFKDTGLLTNNVKFPKSKF